MMKLQFLKKKFTTALNFFETLKLEIHREAIQTPC